MRYVNSGILMLFVAFLGQSALCAVQGPRTGGGGDLCEDRIQGIRDDIKGWIIKGGPAGLTLPTGLSLNQYSQSMLEQIAAAKIICAGQGDPGFPVEIDNTPKFCVFSKTPEVSQITCDFQKFLDMKQSDQYVLVHHEYAGLAGLEPPHGPVSQYPLSNQISKYLQNEVVQRLAVVAPPTPPPNNIQANFGNFVGDYDIVQCSFRSSQVSDGTAVCNNLKESELRFDGNGVDTGFDLDVSMNQISPPWTLTLAWESSPPASCSTFPGQQYCQGIDKDGPFSTDTIIQEINGLVYVRSNNAYSGSTLNFQDLSLVMKKK